MAQEGTSELVYAVKTLSAIMGTAHVSDQYERARKLIAAGVRQADAARFLGLQESNLSSHLKKKQTSKKKQAVE